MLIDVCNSDIFGTVDKSGCMLIGVIFLSHFFITGDPSSCKRQNGCKLPLVLVTYFL